MKFLQFPISTEDKISGNKTQQSKKAECTMRKDLTSTHGLMRQMEVNSVLMINTDQ